MSVFVAEFGAVAVPASSEKSWMMSSISESRLSSVLPRTSRVCRTDLTVVCSRGLLSLPKLRRRPLAIRSIVRMASRADEVDVLQEPVEAGDTQDSDLDVTRTA
jgi:hypothetical protein